MFGLHCLIVPMKICSVCHNGRVVECACLYVGVYLCASMIIIVYAVLCIVDCMVEINLDSDKIYLIYRVVTHDCLCSRRHAGNSPEGPDGNPISQGIDWLSLPTRTQVWPKGQ